MALNVVKLHQSYKPTLQAENLPMMGGHTEHVIKECTTVWSFSDAFLNRYIIREQCDKNILYVRIRLKLCPKQYTKDFNTV